MNSASFVKQNQWFAPSQIQLVAGCFACRNTQVGGLTTPFI